MQIISLSILSVLATSTLAADCLGETPYVLSWYETAYWDARQKMCSNSDCAFQQPCTTYGQKKTAGRAFHVSLSRKNTGSGKGFKDCWDATENIINQCVRDEDVPSGTWSYNDQLYQFSGYFD